MAQFIIYSKRQDALDRSAQAWATKLGRPKRAEDGTKYLWREIDSIDAKSFALYINSDPDLLTVGEQTGAVSALPTNFAAIPSTDIVAVTS